MALCRIPFVSPCSFGTFPSSPKPRKYNIRWNSNQNPVHQGLICASSEEKPRKKKRRPSRAAMSDEELRRELREVMAAAGLAEDRVPLMKELAEHGRKDLANMVRRRGYKAVWELLRISIVSDNHRETDSVEDWELSDPQGDETSEIEERHSTCSAECISSLRSSVVEDHRMINDMYVQNGENSRSSIDPMHFVPANSSQEMEFASGAYREAPPVKEDHQTDRDPDGPPPASTETQQALNILQARAQNEIGNVHRIIWTKDAELRTAESNLSGLKVVEIQYWADGETIEVAGSFNGWHKPIKMDPDISSETFDLPVPRQFKLWSAILWLYPGVYEIKFMVDGQWMIDSGREVIAYGHITNNVLRVDR